MLTDVERAAIGRPARDRAAADPGGPDRPDPTGDGAAAGGRRAHERPP